MNEAGISKDVPVIYSKEFRREVATRFHVSESWVRRIKQDRRELGKTASKATRDLRALCQKWSGWLRQSVSEQPDIYLHELRRSWNLNMRQSCLSGHSARPAERWG